VISRTEGGDQSFRTAYDSPDPWLNAGFAPDFLVPTQYYDLMRRRSALDAETRLVFAVLEDAVRCYVKNVHGTTRVQRLAFREVSEWFDTANRRHDPFSFGHICDVIGIEPGYLRSQLKTLRPDDLPTKQMRSVGRRHVVRPGRRSHHAESAGRRRSALGS